ncbi:elongation factor G [Roseomonas sp. PWR1]|uniref:Elongation factor G n=1 Tax=Roseomonas nitratireducens TaxID=2820810 RepID=A0ABS4AY75_9PROT|nr:elongation factor G [Neoroseomonas nitratireducens]MBP0466328.1 elongation factor G [Neoroseomonas nitratireducens]
MNSGPNEARSPSRRPRAVVLIGPQGSGKSTLFEALLAAAGSPPGRRNGDARQRAMGTEARLGHCTFMGDAWALLDCPGSVEFAQEQAAALAVADLALIVCEPDPGRAATLAPAFHALEAAGLPAMVFVNKADTLGETHVRDTLAALQAHSRRPLVLRQVPIREGGEVTGYVDLVSERAYRWRRGAPSDLIRIPEQMMAREAEARAALAEALADHDDSLLEMVVEDTVPTPDDLYRPMHADVVAGALDPVLIGAAERRHGVLRLWKALRHDVPGPEVTAARRGIAQEGEALAQVFRTLHAGHGGKLSFARIWRGAVKDGATLGGGRIGGITRYMGGEAAKVPEAGMGEVVALGRLESAATGDVLSPSGSAPTLPFPAAPQPVFALAIATEDRKDDVRLSGALARLAEEDPSISVIHDAEAGQILLAGQGDLHLGHAVARLAEAHGVRVATSRPRIAFKETIRHPARHHARHRRQTGGHGQFADVTLEVAPRTRGDGFVFEDRIVGGAIPRKFIPAVGEAAEEAARRGPLGNPVVDVQVTLLDGAFHSVDSSDMAFATATRMAMQEALSKAEPVVLEPVDQVTVLVPQDGTAAAQRLLTGRRGQILGYAEKPDWPGWDEVQALVPESELHDLIIELRSQTMGLGTYTRRFDHLAETRAR